MRENESDSGGERPGPYDDISPWAAHDPGEAGPQPAAGTDPPDSIAFGKLDDEDGQGSYEQRSYSDPWHSSDQDQSRYGSYASADDGYGSRRDGYGSDDGYGARSGGYGSGGEYGSDGGYGSRSGGYRSGGWDPGPPPRRARRRGHLRVYLTVAAVAAVVGAGLTVAFGGSGSNPAASISSSGVPSPHDDAPGSGSALNAAVVKQKVEPGLVDITATLKYASETAEGTGMILSPSGLVLTNNHVIDGSTAVTVSLAANVHRTYQAQVIGYDSIDDVALLQLTGASGLATVSIGDSAQVRVGTQVLALGDAQGRGGVTPSRGYISGLNRSIQATDQGSGSTEDLNHMLQTNAQIQQGDSGGALANSAGQVIGMVTAANTPPDGQTGDSMGFAIPINTALAIAQKIAAGQSSATVYIGLPGFLGVEVAQGNSANPRQQAAGARRSGDNPGGGKAGGGNQAGPGCVADGQAPGVPRRIAPAASGALILGVLCGTAAQSEGLVAGDVVLSVNGQVVTTPNSMTTITAKYHPGAVVSVTWEAINGSRHTARIMLGRGPAR
jgi:S1-C subfamily serine protease